MKSIRVALLLSTALAALAGDPNERPAGARLPSTYQLVLWSAPSGTKVGRTAPVPEAKTDALVLSAARNESEAIQLVVRPVIELSALALSVSTLHGPGGARLPPSCIDLLRVGYVPVAQATDKAGGTGLWPDPLPPLGLLAAPSVGTNHPIWIRVNVPADAAPGLYTGRVALTTGTWTAEVPLQVRVFNFALPDRLACETAFGFNAGQAFRYHGAKTEEQRRRVLEGYWRSFAAHRISPYDPAPLDPIRVKWPDVHPPKSDWQGGRIVTNEARTGRGSLAIFDDRADQVVNAVHEPLIAIPAGGLRLKFAYRTALPGHTFIVSLGHYDAQTNWISGHNHDITIGGNGSWETFDREIKAFPDAARFVQFRVYGTTYTEEGGFTGLVWYDDISLTDLATGAELVRGGDFEPGARRELVAPADTLQPRLDFAAWDREVERVLAAHRFSTFRLHLEGMGGGTYEQIWPPNLLGFTEADPEYELLFGRYVGALTGHLREKGWLDEAYTYWFDEPEPTQYEFVRRGFEKLRRLAPGLRGMLTEEIKPGLIGGPSVWCPVSHEFDTAAAEERRQAGEQLWWYICCVPKAPYATEFIDHPGTALRVWLWQTWQRGIGGILIWDSNYWTSPAAYPDAPQNPYEDPMSWVSSGKPGAKHPWGNGDGRFLYPPEAAASGRPDRFVDEPPVDSIRWEMLRDGLEDYEYLHLLREKLKTAGDKLPAARRAELAALLEVPPEITQDLKTWTHDPAPIEARRAAIATAIEALLGAR